MQAVKVYGLRRCSTCVKATKWLDSRGVDYTFIDYRDEPVAQDVLSTWASALGWKALINRASTSWRALSDEQKEASTDTQRLALIAEHPTLVKRPVLVRDGAVDVGFSEARYAEIFE